MHVSKCRCWLKRWDSTRYLYSSTYIHVVAFVSLHCKILVVQCVWVTSCFFQEAGCQDCKDTDEVPKKDAIWSPSFILTCRFQMITYYFIDNPKHNIFLLAQHRLVYVDLFTCIHMLYFCWQVFDPTPFDFSYKRRRTNLSTLTLEKGGMSTTQRCHTMYQTSCCCVLKVVSLGPGPLPFCVSSQDPRLEEPSQSICHDLLEEGWEDHTCCIHACAFFLVHVDVCMRVMTQCLCLCMQYVCTNTYTSTMIDRCIYLHTVEV